jgi:single-stranded DNA-binding protein
MANWTNLKVPIQTHYKAKVIKIEDLEETKKGDSKLEINCVHNFYDPDEENNQGAFWFRCMFVGDSADRHYKNLSEGDTVIVAPNLTIPMVASTTDEEGKGLYINFKFLFPNLDYVIIANWNKDDDDEEKPRSKSSSRNKSTSKSSQNGSARKPKRRKKSGFFGNS